MLGAVRNGSSHAVFITGDPGIGKSTLLGTLLDHASGLNLLHIRGYEIESSVPFGAIQRLGAPLVDTLDSISPAHRDVLLVAAGRDQGSPPQPSLVGLAALSLLAKFAEAQPVLCIIDDAHHLDPESLEVLGFVARRLSAESVGMVFASRDDDHVRVGLAGVPELSLVGLDAEESAQLLRHVLPGSLDPSVEAAVIAATAGNPLALHELADEWDVHALTRATMVGAPVPIGRQLEQHYAQRVARLPHEAQRWVLVAAAESAGNAGVVRAAAGRLGLPSDASKPLERAGLVTIRDDVRFRHALVRSAVYGAATDAERREAHRALGVEASAAGFEEFAAWHAAAAAEAADPGVAVSLIELADRAAARGGYVSRARLLARAADMSPDAAARDALLVGAAEAAVIAGQARLALELAEDVDLAGLDPVNRGRLLIALGSCGQLLGEPERLYRAKSQYLEAADSFHDAAPATEQYALLLALQVTQSTVSDDDLDHLDEFGQRMRRAIDAAPGPLSVALRAVSSFILDPYETAVPNLRDAVAMLEGLDDAGLVMSASYAVLPGVALWDADLALHALDRVATAARRAGNLRELYGVAWVASAVALSCGNPRQAQEYLEQAADARQAAGYADHAIVSPSQMALSGVPLDVVRQTTDAIGAAGYGGVVRMAQWGIANRLLAAGEYDEAYQLLREVVRRPFMQATLYQYPDLIEAAVRSGRPGDVGDTVQLLRRHAAATGAPWVEGMVARAQALLAPDGEAEGWYQASVDALEGTALVGEHARSLLLFGEWLRRQGRRSDAGARISEAYAIFQEIGSVAFAERARRELLATGVPVPASLRDSLGDLTAQEVAVARLAASGKTNAEIGSVLFISPNTVDYHLRKVFRKLGITSRRQLASALAQSA